MLQLGDLCCLVHNGYGAYEPHNKQWVKDRVFAHLKRMATWFVPCYWAEQREWGQRRGFYGFSMAFMGVSTRSCYVKAEKNECARGGRMCVNRIKSVGRVAAFGGHDGEGEQVLHIYTATRKNALFSRTKIQSLRINTFLYRRHIHTHTKTQKRRKMVEKGVNGYPLFMKRN